MPDFRWTDLTGKTSSASPRRHTMAVHADRAASAGVDPVAVRIERNRPGPEALAAFRGGHGRFSSRPSHRRAAAGNGEAHLVASMGEATGRSRSPHT